MMPPNNQAELVLKQRLQASADEMSSYLQEILQFPSDGMQPARLFEAMKYGSLNGGKRVRPFLVREVAALFGASGDGVMRTATALECVHCYSLIHDDLPAMDNDDLRRGKPTTHKQFDDASAILAGDGLLTYAFEILSEKATHPDPEVRIDLVSILAKAAGPQGMVGGQMLDIESESIARNDQEIRALQAMKTGALLRAACEMGATLGGASHEDRRRLVRFGEIIGLAFQLSDDLLDVTADAAAMGKATGKDAQAGKATLVALNGVDAVKTELAQLVDDSGELLASFGERADILRATAHYVANRKN